MCDPVEYDDGAASAEDFRDAATVDVLMGRVEETRICFSDGAYRMATIGIGTFIEGLLLSVLLEGTKICATR
ncbi:hypothetical protein GCM10027445_13470 [Amycolatopsis endophytica]